MDSREFIGCRSHRVDDSRRVMVPRGWQEIARKYWLLPWPIGAEDRIMALPPERWRELRRRVQDLAVSEAESGALERSIAGSAKAVEVDGVGRLCLPEEMARVAGIGKKAELVGRINKFEIWNPERFAAASAADKKLASAAIKTRLI